MLKRLGNEAQSTSNTSDYENLEQGEYEARLVYVGDLGLQERNFQGEEKPPAQQLSLGLELVDSTVMIDGIEQPRLMWSKPFNIFSTLNEKGRELEMYRVFASGAKEGEVADWDSVLGQPCNVTVVHSKPTAEGVKYDNVQSISPIPAKYKGGVSPARTTDVCIGDSSDLNNAATKALFGLAAYVFGKRLGADSAPPAQAKAKPADDLHDDIPF